MPGLVLGPLLRYVDERSVTIWVETDQPCTVRVLDTVDHTFTVHGHHYALVQIEGLMPGSATPYTVALDGKQVWPEPGTPFPPPRIRTVEPATPLRIAAGSCRSTAPHDKANNRTHGVDVLRAYALQLMREQDNEWPHLLLMLGDQVYADDPSDEMRELIRARRDVSFAPGEQLADFGEYTALYRLAWSEPSIRWLLSTIPTAMIFDDHDVHDDWNTSLAWRQEMAAKPWWSKRIIGALGSYWIYQHLGNLSPAELGSNELLAALRAHGGDAGALLDAFSEQADADPESTRWSYCRDVGRVRLLMLDTRAGRVLEPTRRAMLGDKDMAWVDQQMTGGVDHLLVGTSLPYLLPHGVHFLEAWNEAVADGAWGRRVAAVGERIRQGADLEHWAAFQDSFISVSKLVIDVATGRRGTPPASVTFLSGDVHFSYLAQVKLHDRSQGTAAVYQAVCSPIRNPLPIALRWANGAASFTVAAAVGRLLARSVRVPCPLFDWRFTRGPWFDNVLGLVDINGRHASVRWQTATVDHWGTTSLDEIGAATLA
jgi:PhoD-like phosphatase